MRPKEVGVMADVVFLSIVVGFFAGAIGYVRCCQSIVGRSSPLATAPEEEGLDVGAGVSTGTAVSG